MSKAFKFAKVMLKIHSRDRQAIFFGLFFPLVFMFIISFASGGDPEPIELGIVNNANNNISTDFIASLESTLLFNITIGNEEELREQLIAGDKTVVLVLPDNFQDSGTPADLTVLIDASQVRQAAIVMPVLRTALVDVERQLRNTEPLFDLNVEDVQSRTQSYLDFVVPGLLAFSIMNIAIAGSGFNIVEYRRKGILKRLFVTPIQPRDFIGGLVIARLSICLVQITGLILAAIFLFHVVFVGNLLSLYLFILVGTVIFLCIGFCLGSLAQTQQAIMAIGNLVTFPQMILSGIFFPIEALPDLVQPLAKMLPLSFISSGLREIAINGAGLLELVPSIIGMGLWAVVLLVLSIRLFVWKEVAA
ncbi:MAG: ABC transporter permease [Pseudohongiellaceae bacterium]